MKNALFISILFFLVGCGVSEKDLVGTWTGTVELAQLEEKDKQTSFLQSALGAVTLSIELNEDKTYKTLGVEGTWSYADNKLTLTPTKTLGFNISTPQATLVADVAKDGRSFVLNDPTGKDTGKFVFKKAGQE